MAHAYLSFVEADRLLANEIVGAFERANVAIQYDPDRTRSGAHLPSESEASIANAFAFIVLVSDAALDHPQARTELQRAIERETPILPVRIGEGPLPAWWDERLSNLVHVDGSQHPTHVTEALLHGVRRFFDRLCPVVSLMNLKGGVGKTTLTAQTFAALQKKTGQRVLLVDLDPQHNLSQIFFRRSTQDTLIYMDASAISLFEPSALQDHPSPAESWTDVSLADAPPPRPEQIARRLIVDSNARGRFDLICGQFDIAKYAFLEDRKLIDTARENFICSIDVLREHYDLVVLDTNPSASFLTKCALAVSTRLIAPIRADRFSLRGVRLLNDLITRLLDEPGRPPISVAFNGVDRSNMSEFEQQLRNGELDASVGFPVSKAVLKNRLHTSKFLQVREEGIEDDPLQHLAIYRANGIWAGALKDSLNGMATEIARLVDMSSERVAA